MSKKNVVAISDLHGCFNTFLALLDRARAEWGEFDLYFLGDLIDRGPRSKEMVEYAMSNKIPTVSGNHEDLCLAYSVHQSMGYNGKCAEYYERDIWLANGGIQCLESWGVDWKRGEGLPRNVLDWMASLPPYIIPDADLDDNGRKLMIGHTGYSLDADKDNWMRTLWGRYPNDGEFAYQKGTGEPMDDGLFRCFGHTPKSKAWITDTFAMVDSGAAYKDRGYGNMTAFHWPSKQYIMQPTID